MKVKKYFSYLLIILALVFTSCRLTNDKDVKVSEELIEEKEKSLDEDGSYYSLEDVSSYLFEFNHLPPNYITKKEAIDLGWSPKDGNLWEVRIRL